MDDPTGLGLGLPRRRRPYGSELLPPNPALLALTGNRPVDPVTGLTTRQGLLAALDDLWAGPPGRTVGVVVCNVDHLKTVNSAVGHHDGDQVLAVVAERVAAVAHAAVRSLAVTTSELIMARRTDEFTVVLPGVDSDDALGVATAVVEATTAHPVLVAEPAESVSLAEAAGYFRFFGPESDGTWLIAARNVRPERFGERSELDPAAPAPPILPVSGLLVSVSAGAASGVTGTDTPEALLAAADMALFDAKAGGRAGARRRHTGETPG